MLLLLLLLLLLLSLSLPLPLLVTLYSTWNHLESLGTQSGFVYSQMADTIETRSFKFEYETLAQHLEIDHYVYLWICLHKTTGYFQYINWVHCRQTFHLPPPPTLSRLFSSVTKKELSSPTDLAYIGNPVR